MKYDSVLDQQSISGKIVSLILCVWKPCYVKSGHNYLFYQKQGQIVHNCLTQLRAYNLFNINRIINNRIQQFLIR